MSKILVLERFSLEALALLQSQFEVVCKTKLAPTADEFNACEGLIIRSQTQVNKVLLEKMPNLKVIVTATSGFDHIDLALTQTKNIKVMYVPEGNALSAAELTWALLMACSRKLVQGHFAITRQSWERQPLMGTDLEGLTLGIIGLGRVGKKVAHFAHAFGMHVQYFDPYILPNTAPHFAESTSLMELLRSSEAITLHVPLTKTTKHLINQSTIENINLQPILINTSRGQVVSEQDLAIALTSGRIGAAGLDVFEKEPLPADSPLLQLPQVVRTPHIGATTTQAFARASMGAAQKIVDYFKRSVTSDLLPDSVPWWERST